MGYLAYAAGTLIAAVLIHSLFTNTRKERQDERPQSHAPASTAPIIAVSEPVERDGLAEQKHTAPTISIEIGEDDLLSHERSAPERKPLQGDGATARKTEGANPQARLNGHTTAIQQQSMPPPTRPASAPNLISVAAQARQRAAMLPPSSLPPSRARSPPRLKPATVSSLAPTPRLTVTSRQLPAQNGSSLAPPPSAASSLRVPQQKILTNTRMQPQPFQSVAPGDLTTSTQAPNKRPSRKVILSPGHSPLDWAALMRSTEPSAMTTLRGSNATDVLGPHRMGRITPSHLKQQNGRKGKDAWTVYGGKVYNISAYLDFHPGGRDELMKGAGRSSDQLFAEVHPWVNWDGMLSGCLIGMLVSEEDVGAIGKATMAETNNELDEMD